eukprot:5542213-Amphidinium_carterae.1
MMREKSRIFVEAYGEKPYGMPNDCEVFHEERIMVMCQAQLQTKLLDHPTATLFSHGNQARLLFRHTAAAGELAATPQT